VTIIHAPLLRNPIFDEWSAGSPTEWTHQSTTNATYAQLQESDRKGDSRRTVFPQDKYIYAGKSSFRITMAAAAAANNWILRQEAASSAGMEVLPGQNVSWVLAARCSVPDNYLNVQIIGLVSTTDTFYLRPVAGMFDTVGTSLQPYRSAGFEWSTTASTLCFRLKDKWITTSYYVQGFPLNVTSWSIRVANGSTGAQVIDLGQVEAQAIGSHLGGYG